MEFASNGVGSIVGSGSCQCARLSRLFSPVEEEGIAVVGTVGVGGAVSGGVGLCRIWVKLMARRNCRNRFFLGVFCTSEGFDSQDWSICDVRSKGNWAISLARFAFEDVALRSIGVGLRDSPVQWKGEC